MKKQLGKVPTVAGAYWYFCDKKQDFQICEVKERHDDDRLMAHFTNGSRQAWCGNQSYFIPINKPIVEK
jgi:hypothetical protein